MRALFLFSIFVIIYGSLFPFHFRYEYWLHALQDLSRTTSMFRVRPGDLISNIILFIPFSFAGTLLISRNNKDKIFIVYLFAFGIFLAVSVQILQIFIPSRVPALYDAAWNIVGMIVGYILAIYLKKKYPILLKSDPRLVSLILLFCWIGFLLTPFYFSFNIEELRANIDLHTDINEYRLANIILFTFLWVSAGNFLKEISPDKKSFLWSLEFLVPFTTFAKIFVYKNWVEAELLLSGILAILIIRSNILNKRDLCKISAILLIISMFYNSLYPFGFNIPSDKFFHWVPFEELFSSNILSTSRTIFYKLFIYGSIIWNLRNGFRHSSYIFLFCIIYASSIEYFQHLTLSRIGGITEPLMVLFLCLIIKPPMNEKACTN